MSSPFTEENAASYKRLEGLATGLSVHDLGRSTPYGWTVAGLLVHLAFWDQRVLTLLRRWKSRGLDPSPIDSEAVNDSLKVICHAVDPRIAIDLCLASARSVDAEIETLDSAFVAEIQAAAASNGTQFRLSRALHRNDHIDHIQELLEQP